VSEEVRETGIPGPALAILRAQPGSDGGFDQAIPLLTVDGAGFPDVARLSREQLRPGPNDDELLASVWGPGTRANLLASRRATVVLKLRGPGEHANAKLKLGSSCANSDAVHGRLGNSLRPSTYFRPARLGTVKQLPLRHYAARRMW
jgi:hypothetical protein